MTQLSWSPQFNNCLRILDGFFECQCYYTALTFLNQDNFTFRGTRRFLRKYTENTFQAFQSTFRSLELRSKRARCYKICTCSVILREYESFQNYESITRVFPEHFRCNLTYYEGSERIFLFPLSITFLNPTILGFLFSTKNSLTLGVKCEKLNFRKSQGIYQVSFENCTWKERSSRNFQPSASNRKYQAIYASPNRYFSVNTWLGALDYMISCNSGKTRKVTIYTKREKGKTFICSTLFCIYRYISKYFSI